MNGSDRITITQWVKTLLDAQERVHQAERSADMKALELQAREYERRLEGLNHENARILLNNNTLVSQDKHTSLEADVRKIEKLMPTFTTNDIHATLIETLQKRSDASNSTVNHRLDVLEKWQTSIDGKLIGAGAVITLISIGIGIISHFWQ